MCAAFNMPDFEKKFEKKKDTVQVWLGGGGGSCMGMCVLHNSSVINKGSYQEKFKVQGLLALQLCAPSPYIMSF
jgi:hypothetical protein